MTWVKIDDGFLTHPKAIKAGKDGRALFFAALIYSSRELTDGFIDDSAIPILGAFAEVKNGVAVADLLVRIRLFDREDDGYRIHDYLDYNRSAAAITAEREAAKRRKFGRTSGEPSANVGDGSGEVQRPRNPVPVPVPKGSKEPSRTLTRPAITEDWLDSIQPDHPTVDVREVLRDAENRKTWDGYKDKRRSLLKYVGWAEERMEARNGISLRTGNTSGNGSRGPSGDISNEERKRQFEAVFGPVDA